jgi:hypothetical protein
MVRALCIEANELVAITGALACSLWHVPFSSKQRWLELFAADQMSLYPSLVLWLVPIGAFPFKQTVMAWAHCKSKRAQHLWDKLQPVLQWLVNAKQQQLCLHFHWPALNP